MAKISQIVFSTFAHCHGPPHETFSIFLAMMCWVEGSSSDFKQKVRKNFIFFHYFLKIFAYFFIFFIFGPFCTFYAPLWSAPHHLWPRVGDSGQYQFRNLRYNSCKYRVIPKKIVIDWYCFQYYEIVIAYIHLQLIKVHVFSFLFLTLFQLIQFFIFLERVVFF